MKDRSSFWGLVFFCLIILGVISYFLYESIKKNDSDLVDANPSGFGSDLDWCGDLISRNEMQTVLGKTLKHYYEYSDIGFTNKCDYVLTDGGPTESASVNESAEWLTVELHTCPEKQLECFEFRDVLNGKDGAQDGDTSIGIGKDSRINPTSPEARVILSRNAYLIINVRNPKISELSDSNFNERERIFRQITRLFESRLPQTFR